VNLVSHSGGSCGSNLFARCLSSFRIAVDAGCAVQLTPLAGGGAYVPAIWSTNAAGTYTQLSQCPTTASAAVSTNADPLAADLKAAVQTALERHIYGSSYPVLLSSVVWDRGTIALTASTDGCQLKFGVTVISDELNSITAKLAPDAAEAVCETDGALSVGSECQLSLGVACGAGRQPVALTGSTKACPLCSAGAPAAALSLLLLLVLLLLLLCCSYCILLRVCGRCLGRCTALLTQQTTLPALLMQAATLETAPAAHPAVLASMHPVQAPPTATQHALPGLMHHPQVKSARQPAS
jgi:hypothetical protein